MWVCRLPVHIGPAGCTGFTEILGEFVTSHWADRVVGPYGKASMHTYPVGADDSVRPQDISVLRISSAKPQLPSGPMWASAPTELRRIRTSLQVLNERRFYSRYSQIWCTITGGAYQSARRVSPCVRNTQK